MNFPSILASLRREQGLSQRQTASQLGISQALLSHYENGTREPGLEFLIKVCSFYGVSADYILGLSPDRKPVNRASEAAAKALEEIAKTALNALKETE